MIKVDLRLTLGTLLFFVLSMNRCHFAAGFATPRHQVQQSSAFVARPGTGCWGKRGDAWQLFMSVDNGENQAEENKLPFFLDPGTKGGAIFLSIVAFVVPILFYQFITGVFGLDGIEAGKWIGGIFTVFATLAWVSSYIFRVATKDMTYAKQLKDYENAVIAKRLEELDEDELQALVEEVERDEF